MACEHFHICEGLTLARQIEHAVLLLHAWCATLKFSLAIIIIILWTFLLLRSYQTFSAFEPLIIDAPALLGWLALAVLQGRQLLEHVFIWKLVTATDLRRWQLLSKPVVLDAAEDGEEEGNDAQEEKHSQENPLHLL